MTGIELILSAVCNITSCGPNVTLPVAPTGFPTVKIQRDMEIKATKEMVNGKHFRVGTIQDGLRGSAVVDGNGKLLGVGIAFDILNELAHKLNFTYEIILPLDYFKYPDRDTMESLLVQMLIDHQIDIAAAFISFTMDRKDLITFALEVDTVNCLITLNNFPNSNKQFHSEEAVHLLQPFYSNVWCLFFLTLTLYVACLMLLTRLRSKLINDGEESFTLSSSLSYAYRVMTKQSIQKPHKAAMTRTLLITWSIFVMLVSTYYGAHLSQGYILSAVTKEDSTNLELLAMNASRIPLDASKFKSLGDCYSSLTIDRILRRPSGFAYPKNTTLNKLFDAEIKRMYYYGYLQKYLDNYKKFVKKACTMLMKSDTYQLKTTNMAPVFYCWATGTVTAIAVFIIELLVKRLTKSNETEVVQTNSEQMDNVVVHHEVAPPTCRFEISPNPPRSPFQRRIVNGRQYLVARTRDGDVRLVPVDTLSALLYDLDMYEEV